jgi:hypothetical protein
MPTFLARKGVQREPSSHSPSPGTAAGRSRAVGQSLNTIDDEIA